MDRMGWDSYAWAAARQASSVRLYRHWQSAWAARFPFTYSLSTYLIVAHWRR